MPGLCLVFILPLIDPRGHELDCARIVEALCSEHAAGDFTHDGVVVVAVADVAFLAGGVAVRHPCRGGCEFLEAGGAGDLVADVGRCEKVVLEVRRRPEFAFAFEGRADVGSAGRIVEALD